MIDLHLSAFAPRWRFLYVVRIDAYAQTDGFDRCPRFLRRHEVCYMEAHFVMG